MKVIVLDGGPCGGKTTALTRVTQELSDLGWKVIVRPEAATLIGECGVQFDKVETYTLQHTIVETMLRMEDALINLYKKHPKCIMLCDRGLLSSKPYDPLVFNQVAFALDMSTADIVRRYDAVFHMRSVAVDNPNLYTTSNNKVRYETVQEACTKDKETEKCWYLHPHFRVIENKGSFDDKINELVSHIKAVLGEPVRYEHECKFLVDIDDAVNNHILRDAVVLQIEQRYHNADTGFMQAGSKRVRKTTYEDGSSLYTHTEKFRDVNNLQVETERIITKSEYEALSKTYLSAIRKTRRNFTYKGTFFELDEFKHWNDSLFVLEVETLEPNSEFELPPFKIIREVTNDSAFSNKNMSILGVF